MTAERSPFDRLMEEGRAAAALGHVDAARRNFLAADGLRPKSVLPSVELLRLAEQAADPPAYRHLLGAAVARFPEAAFLVLRLGRLDLNSGDAASAARQAERAFAAAPDAAMMMHAAMLARDADGVVAGRDMLARAMQRFPGAPELRWREIDWRDPPIPPLAEISERRMIAECHPGNAEIQFLFAEQAANLGCFGDAEAALARVGDTAADAARKSMRLGNIRLQQWRLTEAACHFTAARGFPAFDVDALENLIRLHIMTGAAGEASRLLHELFRKTRLRRAQQGLTQRPMHSFLGSILREFQLRATDVEGLLNARHESLPAALTILRQSLSGRPISTPAALMAAVMLRQAGLFAEGRATSGPLRFPRRIMQFWHSEAPPGDIAARMAGWRELNPGWDYVRFDTASALQFLSERFPPEVALAFRLARHAARRADLFRFAYLLSEGGCYVDADSLAQAPLDGYLPGGCDVFIYQEPMGSLANDFLCAAPGHPMVRACVTELVAAINAPGWENTWNATGPGLFTRVAVTHWLQDSGIEDLGRSTVASRHRMRRFMSPNLPAAYKSTAGHWLRTDFGGKGAIVSRS